jgi:protein SCO1/2
MRKGFMKLIWSLLCSGLLPAAFAAAPCCATNTPPAKACCAEVKAEHPLSDRSIYQVESVWTNDFKKALKLASLRGKPQILVMFFASCEYACPVLVHDVKKIEASLPEEVQKSIGITFVSFDTERDTPEALHAYRERMELPQDRWNLLRGGQDDVLELAALLGVKFKKEARGQFAHSNLITILNADGEIAAQFAGLHQDSAAPVALLKSLVSKTAAR